ncbi:Polyphosphate kinase [Piscirickettsia salmonis]|uniref:Polyphosphate kinase n=1 Tax=Piscirickettsia salmonis TaxID=1238 RepID=A0AAC8VKK9_PISSA|nr:polyphosphate kinase 1 [Piscirickettsia salmonis]ALB24175.1 polyphosphate kinase 1 [Piscirickettsia salmonis]QGN97232.1 Polyphosphate kinase [Piscirickettsia salmonis]QGO00828.1 Polyphosphate kinase [Piscirickettsia salmonis]QGO11552.1 Polyphosphate kinase [Piscirickettsia salmonis]QGO18575.1 Polyphosphate kinase [Piscirickettsia salmonis]
MAEGKLKKIKEIDLSDPELYLDRELSFIEFNQRVVQQAADETVPLLERLHFLSIASSNLDEFFEIRVAGVKQRLNYNSQTQNDAGLLPQELIRNISVQTHVLVKEQYRLFYEELIPKLAKENIEFHFAVDGLVESKQAWLKRYFRNEILPVVSPIGLDYAHPFPRLVNKSLNFIVSLEGKDAFGRDSGLAIVHVPRALPQLIEVPDKEDEKKTGLIFLSSIVQEYIGDLFPGMTAMGCYPFRLTRNSDLFLDEEDVDDLAHALQGELLSRRYGEAVRLEVAENCPEEIQAFLLRQYVLTTDDLYFIHGPATLLSLSAVIGILDRPDLMYPPFVPLLPKGLRNKNLFDMVSEKDILLLHPFESFKPIVDLVLQAARDPNVMVIKQTLYRSEATSKMVDALVEAARAGKAVTAVVELRARFNEEDNISLANRLQQAGALVVYGVVGYKTHAKMTLIVRREGRKFKYYVHLGTGNYHEKNALVYTDYSLFSHNQELAEDVHRVFQQLTGMGKTTKLKKLIQSPFTMHKTLIKFIQREVEFVNAGKPGKVIAKMNALTEQELIRELYRASQAGVEIELIVRGVCCLRPGIKGVSDNIKVKSIVGRFLEHSRIYYFRNGGEAEVYCSSADWMERNLFSRVEVCFPIQDTKLKQRVISDGLTTYLSDNSQSWLLNADGSYTRSVPRSQEPRSAQQQLLDKYS